MTSEAPKCPVCADLLYEAFVAPCGHSLCVECKDKIMCETGGPRKCPECRAKVAAYAPNFSTRALVETQFAAEHKKRFEQTTEGKIKLFCDANPGVVVRNSEHDPEFVLRLLYIAVGSKTSDEALESVGGATSRFCKMIAWAVCDGADEKASCLNRGFRTTIVATTRLVLTVASLDENPLSSDNVT